MFSSSGSTVDLLYIIILTHSLILTHSWRGGWARWVKDDSDIRVDSMYTNHLVLGHPMVSVYSSKGCTTVILKLLFTGSETVIVCSERACRHASTNRTVSTECESHDPAEQHAQTSETNVSMESQFHGKFLSWYTPHETCSASSHTQTHPDDEDVWSIIVDMSPATNHSGHLSPLDQPHCNARACALATDTHH